MRNKIGQRTFDLDDAPGTPPMGHLVAGTTTRRMCAPMGVRAVAYACQVPPSGETRFASLTELVAAARSGDSAAWEELVSRFERLVWKVANSFGLEATVREDVFQNTWLRLFESIGAIREPERLPGWVARTTANEAKAMIRKRRLVPVDHIDERPDNFTDPPDNNMLETELRAALRVAFAELSDRCRRILRLLTCDPPLSYAEIAALLEATVGYVGPTRGRCLRELRARPVMAPFLRASS